MKIKLIQNENETNLEGKSALVCFVEGGQTTFEGNKIVALNLDTVQWITIEPEETK